MSWTIGNFYLTTEQMQGNAREVLSFFEQKGWSLNAIAGICGNMQSESNINPGIWQSLQEGNYSGGFGLVQWLSLIHIYFELEERVEAALDAADLFWQKSEQYIKSENMYEVLYEVEG